MPYSTIFHFHIVTQTDEGEDDLKKGTQLLEIYALEIQMYTSQVQVTLLITNPFTIRGSYYCINQYPVILIIQLAQLMMFYLPDVHLFISFSQGMIIIQSIFFFQKNNKKLKALYEQSLHIKSAIPHPLIMGVIRGKGENITMDFFLYC